jgi:2,3-bisphosphoglycerate-independent phosphoglycerate mutase
VSNSLSLKNNNSLKIIYVILDGIGDLPHKSIKNLTPLEASNTPNLDYLAKNGIMGQVITVGKGIAPQSDIAVFNMLGYNFKDAPYVGRGVVESIGCDIDFKDGDLALRGNFATVDENQQILDRRAGRFITNEEAQSLCKTLNSEISLKDSDASVVVMPTIAHRVTIRFRHNKTKLSDQITNTDPAYDKVNGMGVAKTDIAEMKVLKSVPQNDDISSKISSDIVNDFTNQVYLLSKDHPVNKARKERKLNPMNCILVRDAGNAIPNYEPIQEKYNMKVACVVDMPVEIGISKILGMEPIEAGRINDYITKAKVTSKEIENYNLIYVHIKGPDEFGHDGDALGKKENIEKIDKDFFGTLLKELKDSNIVIVVSGDHSTPCVKKSHSDDPVPLLVSGKSIKTNDDDDNSNNNNNDKDYNNKHNPQRFTESFAKTGLIGTINGFEVLNQTINIIKRTNNLLK